MTPMPNTPTPIEPDVDVAEAPFAPTGFFEPYAQQETPALTAMTRESAIAAMERNAKSQGYLLGPVMDLDPHWVWVKGERVMMCVVKASIVGRVA